MKKIIIAFILFKISPLEAQTPGKDIWTNFKLTPQIGVGFTCCDTVNNRISGYIVRAGINFSRYKGFYPNNFMAPLLEFKAQNYGATIELIPRFPKDILMTNYYSFNFHADYVITLLLFGLEAKYITDFNNSNFIIAPKVGLSLGNVINMYVCANLPIGKTLIDPGITSFGNLYWNTGVK